MIEKIENLESGLFFCHCFVTIKVSYGKETEGRPIPYLYSETRLPAEQGGPPE